MIAIWISQSESQIALNKQLLQFLFNYLLVCDEWETWWWLYVCGLVSLQPLNRKLYYAQKFKSHFYFAKNYEKETIYNKIRMDFFVRVNGHQMWCRVRNSIWNVQRITFHIRSQHPYESPMHSSLYCVHFWNNFSTVRHHAVSGDSFRLRCVHFSQAAFNYRGFLPLVLILRVFFFGLFQISFHTRLFGCKKKDTWPRCDSIELDILSSIFSFEFCAATNWNVALLFETQMKNRFGRMNFWL